MKPNFLNVFMKKLTRGRLVPAISTRVFLTEFGDSNLGLSILAEASQQEQKASQSFLAGIEKLVNQVLFISDVPRKQIRHEHILKRVFPAKHFPSWTSFRFASRSNRSLRLRSIGGEAAL